MDGIINVLNQIEEALQPSPFDHLTFFIAAVGLFLSLHTIIRENRIRTFESIPVLLINEEALFGDFLKYEAIKADVPPFDIEIINFSKASAYDVEISVNPNFYELVHRGLLSQRNKNSFIENYAYRNSVISLSENESYFKQTETELDKKIFYEDLVIKRKAILGNDKAKISTTELMNFNDLIESYTCFSKLQEKKFKLPFTLVINYKDISSKTYSSEYKLNLNLTGGTFQIDSNDELKYQIINYQVENLSVSSSALNKRKRLL